MATPFYVMQNDLEMMALESIYGQKPLDEKDKKGRINGITR